MIGAAPPGHQPRRGPRITGVRGLARWAAGLAPWAAGLALAALLAASPQAAGAAPAPGSTGPSPTARAQSASATGGRAASTTRPATDPNALSEPPQSAARPPAHRLSPRRALAIAGAVPSVRDAAADAPGSYPIAYLKGVLDWQVSYYAHGQEIAQVLIDDSTGRVLEAWTGFKVAWSMARGYPGAFGRHADALYVWIPLSVLFVLPFVDPRRWRRLLHLDLLALSAFSASLALFNHGNIDASVPLAYPPLVYLLVRMVLVARRPQPAGQPLRLLVPTSWLTVAVVFLVGFRIGLDVTDSNVIDVGYAGVIGAHRLVHGQPLYGAFPHDNQHGDTYGPVVYEAYVPFERLFGWSGTWDDLPAAHAAAVAFDLLALALLLLIGRRIRGPTLGVALAYGWVTYPFTLFALCTNTNDALVAVLVLAALLVSARPAARGALAALGGLSKFAPLALIPLLAFGPQDGRRPGRALARFAVGLSVAGLVALAPVLAHDSLTSFYERTISFQASRGSPFSAWGLYGGLGAVQIAVQLAALALALAAPSLLRRRDVVGLAALAAAVLIALQLGVTHWFYLYLVWFFPLVLIALLGGGPQDLVDRVGAPGLRAADQHSHQPRVLV